MKNNNKGAVSIVLVILVVIAAAGIGYFAFKKSGVPTPKTEQPQSQQPTTATNNQPVAANDETAGWQTYRNEKFGFEFKYPANWKPENSIEINNPDTLFSLQLTELDPSLTGSKMNGKFDKQPTLYLLPISSIGVFKFPVTEVGSWYTYDSAKDSFILNAEEIYGELKTSIVSWKDLPEYRKLVTATGSNVFIGPHMFEPSCSGYSYFLIEKNKKLVFVTDFNFCPQNPTKSIRDYSKSLKNTIEEIVKTIKTS